MMKKRWQRLKDRTWKYGAPALVAMSFTAFGVFTGVQRGCCDIHNEFAAAMEKYFRDPSHKHPYGDEEVDEWMNIIRSSHVVGHHHRTRYEKTAYRSVMGAFKNAMKRTSVD